MDPFPPPYFALAFVSDSWRLVLRSCLQSSATASDLKEKLYSIRKRGLKEKKKAELHLRLLTGGYVLFLNLGTLPSGARGWTDGLLARRLS